MQLLAHQRLPLLSLAVAFRTRTPAVLYGPPGSGRTTSIKEAVRSQLGADVRILRIRVSHATDASDLVGCFEQKTAPGLGGHPLALNLLAASRDLEVFCRQGIKARADGTASRSLAMALWRIGHALEKARDWESAGSGADVPTFVQTGNLIHAEASNCLSLCKKLQLGRADALDAAGMALAAWNERKATLKSDDAGSTRGVFHWVDGPLTRAVRDGMVLVIEGANFAPPAVMDRLNALLEPNGVLALPECGDRGEGMTEDEAGERVVTPSEHFRAVFVVDTMPASGQTIGPELSRAMRNRCIESFQLW